LRKDLCKGYFKGKVGKHQNRRSFAVLSGGRREREGQTKESALGRKNTEHLEWRKVATEKKPFRNRKATSGGQHGGRRPGEGRKRGEGGK